MKLDEIRKKFLDYFAGQGHEVVSSSSLIPQGDPTLLFTNAGMNQFKDVFLGAEKRSYVRAATSQKCFRASGKHNDLENVGRTARHHTFFEMLGNFSFGDYFKEDAIRYAWELLTVEFALPKDRLWITVFRDDDEAEELWKKVAGVPASRVVRMGEKDNFWSMGDVGPCGPCSEIHIDQGPEVGCGRPDCKLGCECDRYLELWNLVFMQFDRDASGTMTPLPRPSIDTGMGAERIAAVLQGKHNNYDIDHFQTIIRRVGELTGTEYGRDEKTDVSLRVIADHARAMSFLIADGILPSNEGRGYVLRRVMRRAGRHAKMLGKDEPALFGVAETVVDLMGPAYHELLDKRAFISEVVRKEEERFLETLDAGLKILQEEIFKKTARGMVEDKVLRMAKKARAEEEIDEETRKIMEETGTTAAANESYEEALEDIQKRAAEGAAIKQMWKVSGELAFKLYDTYGFPLDLTQTIAAEEGGDVDVEGFEKAMEAQRERAREHWKGSGEEVVESVYKEILNSSGPTEFLGYKTTRASAKVVALIQDGSLVDSADKEGAAFQLVTDRTPFYGESGGQVGDRGTITAGGLEIEVTDSTRPASSLFVHHCLLKKGSVSLGQTVNLAVDEERRLDTARNHSATHLLQHALRRVVGDHVHQKGSLVTPDRFRFDLTHFSPLGKDELAGIEIMVNDLIRENHEIKVHNLNYKDAVSRGAIALFGEKYGEKVRMIEMGDFSRELCGGTHASRTGDVGSFKILSESGVASGVRRVEAVTGRAAVIHFQETEKNLLEAAERLKAKPDEVADRVIKLQEEIKALKRDFKQKLEKRLMEGEGDVMSRAVEVGGVKVIAHKVEVEDGKDLRGLGDEIKAKIGSGVAVIGAEAGGKAHLLAVVSPDLVKKVKAGDLVRELAPIVGGKGGGRPDFAQAGGPDPEKLDEALAKVIDLVKQRL